MTLQPQHRLLVSAFLVSALLSTGCADRSSLPSAAPNPLAITGSVHGGQQPVTGASIQLYTVGTTGDGSPATPLLTQTVQSDASGSFTLTNLYSCSSATQVYITATGGNPGLSSPNPNLALMTALGPCSSLTPSTFISINELTTVAAITALAPYTASLTNIGSATADASSLAAAFTLASAYVNPSTGLAPGATIPTGYSVPVSQLNTLADIVSSCINSPGGVSGDSTPCGQFFSLTSLANAASPTDTITALLNLTRNPSLNTPGLYNLVTSTAPFQPQLTSPPPDFLIRLTPPSNPAANLTVSVPSLTFGSISIGTTAPTQTVVISNPTTAAIPLTSLALTGTNPRDFFASTCPASLAPAASCTVQVNATPVGAGTRSAYLAITSPTSASPQYVSLSVNGTGSAGTAAQVTLSSYTLGFGDFPSTASITVTNAGNAPLIIQSINVTGSFTEADNCGASLFGQSVCTITVQSPFSLGLISGSLTLVDNDLTDPQTVALSAGGSSGTLVYFGASPVGTQASTLLPLNPTIGGHYGDSYYSDAYLAGANATDFSGLAPNGLYCVGEITQYPPNNCALQIAFKPSAPGPRGTYLSYTTWGPGQTGGTPTPMVTTNYILVGVGNNPAGAAAFFTPPGPLGLTELTPSAFTLTLTNTGSTTLQFGGTTSFSTTSARTTVTGTTCASLAPNAACTVTLVDTPAAGTGGTTQSFSVSATDITSGAQFSTVISGTIAYQPLTANTSTLTFPATHINSSAPPQTITVTNPDGHPLTTSFPPSSPGSDFQISPSTCSTKTCVFTVIFAPVTNANVGSGDEGTAFYITDTVSQMKLSLDLSGTRGLATFTVNPTTLNFITRPVGTTSVAQTVTISNTGDGGGTVSISSPSGPTTGSNGSDFISTGHSSSVISAGSYITLSYSFAPTASGVRNATVTVTDNFGNVTTITLNGSGQ